MFAVDRGRRTRLLTSYPTAVWVFVVVVALAGCTQDSASAPTPTATLPAPAHAVANEIDPRWMGLGTNELWNWKIVDRVITPEFQQFGVRPLNSEEIPRRGGCCGHGKEASTAFLTAFAPGKFDPAEARSDQPVNVYGREGYFRPSVDVEDAVLTWSYADDAWATLYGRSSDTSELDVMVALAGDLRPTERIPVRLPLSLANVPVDMPLSKIAIQRGPWAVTSVEFDACQSPVYGVPAPECASTADTLKIAIWQHDDFFQAYGDGNTPTFHEGAVAITVGGKEGLYNEASNVADVEIPPEMVAVFSLHARGPQSGPASSRETTKLKDVLAGVEWASDPGSEQTWPEVTAWAK